MKFKQTLSELRAQKFLKKHQLELRKAGKPFIKLFNDAGNETKDGNAQLSVLGSYIATVCNATNMPASQIGILLENLAEKFKRKK